MVMDSEFLTDTVLEWFQGLDYEYMVLHIIICYGLYYSDNLRWIVEWLSPIRKKGISKAVWVIGGILAGIEIIRYIPFAIEQKLDYTHITDKIISIFHSYVLIQVFVDPIVQTVHKWIGVFRKSTGELTDNSDKKRDRELKS